MEYPYNSLTFKQIHELLGKYIKVHLLSGIKTTNTTSLEGFLYTIDPVTKTLVLLKEKVTLNVPKIENEEAKEDKEDKRDKKDKEDKEDKEIISKEQEVVLETYQIIVIMKSIIQTLSTVDDVKPLTDKVLSTIIPNQHIVYLEKTDSIEKLKMSLIEYLEKNKIDYMTQPDNLTIKIYNERVQINPPYTQSCINSDHFGSKKLGNIPYQKMVG